MRLNQQNNGTIILDGTNRRLPMLTARSGSSSVYWMVPQYPVGEMTMRIASPDGGSWAATLKANCHPKLGRFSVHVPGDVFAPGRYETTYQVSSVDENGASRVDGEGIMRVYGNAIPENSTTES